MMLQSLKPGTGSLWPGKHPWHLDSHGIWAQGWVLRQTAAAWQPNSPTITMGELGKPLSVELGTALGSAGGCSRELGSGALGSHPASVLSWLGSFGYIS